VVDTSRGMKRLQLGLRDSRDQLEKYRKARMVMVQAMVGEFYGSQDGAGTSRMPLPMLSNAIRIYMRHLVARRPAALATTPHKQLKPFAATLGLALDRLMDEIGFGKTMQSVAFDAMFVLGVGKVGMARFSDEVFGEEYDLGQPYFMPVGLDDLVFDMTARVWEATAFVGDRFKLPLTFVQDPQNGFENTKDLVADSEGAGDERGEPKLEEMSREGTATGDDKYQKMISLWEIYIRADKRLVTIPAGMTGVGDLPVLQSRDYWGPEGGPYHMLGYGEVPDQIVPLAPAMLWTNLHRLANAIYNKLGNQALRQKENPTYRNETDAQRNKDADDGEWIRSMDPSNINVVRSGGADPANAAFSLDLENRFNQSAGNVALLAGTGPQSETATQDMMLSRSANKTIEDMQDRTVNFSGGVMEALAWYLMNDPDITLPLVKRAAGTRVEVDIEYNAKTMEGDFFDYNFSVTPYSMQYLPPEARLRNMMNLYQNVVMPGMPLMQQQGIEWDMAGFIKLMAKYGSMDEIDDLVRFADGPSNDEGPVKPDALKPPNTSREVVRTSRPGGTEAGSNAALQQMFSGMVSKDPNLAGLGRQNT